MLIKPISELKNYNNVLDNVKNGSPVYLTKNGNGKYVIYSIDDATEYEEIKRIKDELQNIKLHDMDFFVSDIESFEVKIKKSEENALKNKKRYTHDEIFSSVRKGLNNE